MFCQRELIELYAATAKERDELKREVRRLNVLLGEYEPEHKRKCELDALGGNVRIAANKEN
jgi:hypothetical protein